MEGRPLFALKDVLWWTMLYGLSLVMGTCAIKAGDLPVKRMLPGILTGGFFCIFLSLVAVWSVFFPQKQWIPIAHVHQEGPEK